MTSPHACARSNGPPAGPRRSWSSRDPRAPSPKPRAPSPMEIFRAPRVTLIARPEFIEAGYSQLSQRYVDESQAAFVMPPAILGDPTLETEWEQEVAHAQAAYVRAVAGLMEGYGWVADKVHRRKMAREAARSVLPNATEVK